jgi:predicted O-linked N-acetylglucosamine transferase (SPINDLY family)
MSTLTLQQALEQAVQHHRGGRLAEAEAIYRAILSQHPDQPDALHHLGLIAIQAGRNDVAVQLIGKAVSVRPGIAEFHNHLGLALVGVRASEQAINEFRKALQIKPDLAEAYFGLGNAHRQLGQLEPARAALREAVRLKPDYAWAYTNLGVASLDQRAFDDAIAAFGAATKIEPKNPDFQNNYATALRAAGRLGEAVRVYRHALELRPNWADFLSNLGNTLLEQGELDAGIATLRQAVAANPKDPLSGSDLLYALHFDPSIDARSLLAEHRVWAARHAAPLKAQIQPHPNDRHPDRPLRVGYVSCDFREHAVGRFFLPLLREHDRKQFQTFCYTTGTIEDAKTEAIKSLAGVWRRVVGFPDEQLVQIIRQDRIDILVDLSAHCAGNRLLVFARKPAPVQVTYLSYPSTTGVEAIDYRMTDPFLDPPGQDDSIYVEKSWRLPTLYWCYEPGIDAPPISPAPASQAGFITFGCLNTFRKVSEQTLKTWCELMRQIPASRLLLHANDGEHRERTRSRMQQEGIDPSRISFVGYQSLPDYFATYQRIDIALDPFPYAGGTTTCDALWMGVPVVSLAGRMAVHRSGLSILNAVGLPELVASNTEQYLEIARQLAGDLPRISQLRASLRERMRASELMNAPRFAREMEAAYRAMWRAWCGT